MSGTGSSSAAVLASSNDDSLRSATNDSGARRRSASRDVAQKLVSAMLEEIEGTSDGARRVELLHEVASIYEEQLEEPERAFDAMLVAWAEDYTDKTTANALTRLSERVRGWSELLTVARDALARELPPKHRLLVSLQCAHWYEQLERPESAIACYQQVLAIEPGHRPSLLRLATLHERAEQWDGAMGALECAIRLSTDADEKVQLSLRLAALCEGPIRCITKALSLYREVLELDRGSDTAADALERIYAREERWDDLIALLKQRAQGTRDSGIAAKAWLSLAQLWHGRLNDADKAIDAYRRVLAYDSQNVVALRCLEELLRATERWRELPEVLEGQVRASNSNRERVEILTRLALLWEQTFIRRDKALTCLEQARAIDGDDRAVLQGLSGLYRQAQRWPELLETLEALLRTANQSERATTLKAIAFLCTTEVDDMLRAIRAYEELHVWDTSDLEVLRELVLLHERAGNVRAAVEKMERLAREERDQEVRAELFLRLGHIYRRELHEQEAALARYARAVELCPARADMLSALREAQVAARDFPAASRTLLAEIEVARSPRVIADLNLALARILSDELNEADKAEVFLERAYAHDQDNAQAALLLSNAYVKARKWSRALPMLERIAKRSGAKACPESGDTRELGADGRKRAAVLLGEVAGRCGDHALSALGYEQALELDPSDLHSALGAASAHFRLENWPQVDAAYQRVLRQWESHLDAQARGEALRRRGLSLLARGQPRKALPLLKGALKASPQDPLTLRALIALHQDARQWKKVISYKSLLAEILPEDDRVRLQAEIATLVRDELDNPRKAIEVLRRALEASPGNRVLQHALLSLYQDARRWRDAIQLIETIAKGEERPEVASKYTYTAGVIARDELQDARGALALFERALDLDADHLKAFEAIDRLLTRSKDWKQLERSYRKMLHRVIARASTPPEVVHRLWHGLGIIYRDRMGDLVSAAEAFEQARRIEPDSDTKLCILAELYARIPGELQKAVDEHHRRIERDVSNAAPYHLLYELYREHGAIDRAFCVARALVFLGAANREQRALYQSFDAEPRFSRHRITSEDWLLQLYHPDHDRSLATIFRCLAEPVHTRRFGTTVAPSRKKARVFAGKSSELSAMFEGAARVLSVDVCPQLVVHPSALHGLRSEAAAAPTTVAGRLLCERRKSSELRFLLGHHLAYHRYEHYIRVLLPSRQELGAAVLVAMRSIGRSDGTRSTDEAWNSICRVASTETVERIRKACALFEKRGEPANIKRFIQTAELTACRAGLLLSNDLSASLAMMEQLESAGPDDVSPATKRAAMLSFSVSESYFQLRSRVGLAIAGPSTPWDQVVLPAASA